MIDIHIARPREAQPFTRENQQVIVRGGRVKGCASRDCYGWNRVSRRLFTRDALKSQRDRARALYDEDRLNRVAGVWLPEALARKFRGAGERWPRKSLRLRGLLETVRMNRFLMRGEPREA